MAGNGDLMNEFVPTGQQFVICHGQQQATITEVGASLRRYRVGERDVVVSYPASQLPPAVHGAVLWPWPNRLGDGAYTFAGVEHRLPLTEPERGNAIHGLVLHTRWSLVEHSATGVRLGLDLVPRAGYPFGLRGDIRYALDEHGLSVRLRTTNIGPEAAPYGVGFHPWLSPGAHRLDDCTLQVHADTWVQTDELLRPVRETAIPSRLDFRSPRRLGSTAIDDGFVDLPAAPSWVRLTDPDGVQVACRIDAGLECWQVCTGDELPGALARGGLAAEPMTCTADALRTGRRLIHLAPGQEHEVAFGLMLRELR